MAFNPGQYMQALAGQQQASRALQGGKSKASSKQIQAQEFGLDETIKYADKQKKASSIFGKWKSGAGLVGGLTAMALGAPWLVAAVLAGGSTYLGGKHGKRKAKEELDKSNFFKGQTGQVMDYMDKDITKSTLLAAATAAGGAHLRDLQAAKPIPHAPGQAPVDEKSIEGWINPDTGVQGTVKEYDALVKSRQAGYTPDGNLRPEFTGTMQGAGGGEELIQVDSPLLGRTRAIQVPSRELPSARDYIAPDISKGQQLMQEWGQNLGYTGKGIAEYGKDFLSSYKMFNKGSSMSDLYNNVKTASSVYGEVYK